MLCFHSVNIVAEVGQCGKFMLTKIQYKYAIKRMETLMQCFHYSPSEFQIWRILFLHNVIHMYSELKTIRPQPNQLTSSL